MSFIGSFVTTISAFTEPGCKGASKDPHASLGKEFQLELPGWCTTKKAGAFFFWFAFRKSGPLTPSACLQVHVARLIRYVYALTQNHFARDLKL